ncbi:efflux RND transporter periplasmic adaptor subunit [Vibrio salinus]|uniref:efflux RND transporter periplasmic adaptor subunit n=1 Tax=Vibrio salinus TaxID=2899784 RepID=UPI001E50D794|nr:efflux RND transporter periplasmic adaptor subunit [Vibrio salinus]MCE0495388.1 efflux RND transporter periplasmic adaptor subunit [Vibrio salinus]
MGLLKKKYRVLGYVCVLLTPLFSFAENDSLYKVEKQIVPVYLPLDGTVEAVNQGTVAAQTSGRVIGINVDVNDKVKKGAVLLEISRTEQTAVLDSARAGLTSAIARNDDAQSQLKRFRQLFPKGAISRQQMDSAIASAKSAGAAVKSAEAAVKRAKESLGYTNIRAPYDGIVTKRHVELGETVSVGTPLLSGYGTHPLRIALDIPQQYRNRIHSADQFSVVLPSGKKVSPLDYQIFPYADVRTHAFKIRLTIPDSATNSEQLVPGIWLKLNVQIGQNELMLIPKSSVVVRGELSSVYRLSDQKRMLNPVRTGQEFGDDVEVLSGLEPGDEILQDAYRL